jgi:hypothetical protein
LLHISDWEGALSHEESSAQQSEGHEGDSSHDGVKEELRINFVDPIGISHFRLPQAFVHVEFIIWLVKPALLKSIDAFELGFAVGNWWYNLFVSHFNYIIHFIYICYKSIMDTKTIKLSP